MCFGLGFGSQDVAAAQRARRVARKEDMCSATQGRHAQRSTWQAACTQLSAQHARQAAQRNATRNVQGRLRSARGQIVLYIAERGSLARDVLEWV